MSEQDEAKFYEFECPECKKPLVSMAFRGQIDIVCGHCRMQYCLNIKKPKSEDTTE